MRDATSSLDSSETTEESIGGRKRRQEQDLSAQSQHAAAPNGELFVAVYTRAIPASHGQLPAFFWIVANSNNQVMSGNAIWTFPSVNNNLLLEHCDGHFGYFIYTNKQKKKKQNKTNYRVQNYTSVVKVDHI